MVRNVTAQNKKPKTVMDMKLTEEQKQMLMTSFSSHRLDFTGSTSHVHPFAAATRICEMEAILTMVKYDNIHPPVDYDAKVIDVGGNWATHFKRSRLFVHSVSPCISAYNSKRMTERLTEL